MNSDALVLHSVHILQLFDLTPLLLHEPGMAIQSLIQSIQSILTEWNSLTVECVEFVHNQT